jgi:hypothetical protein
MTVTTTIQHFSIVWSVLPRTNMPLSLTAHRLLDTLTTRPNSSEVSKWSWSSLQVPLPIECQARFRLSLNDVKARRVSTLISIGASPFPDFDHTLQNLGEVDSKFGQPSVVVRGRC